MKKLQCVETGEVFDSIKDANAAYDISTVSAVLHGRQKKAGGYHWIAIDQSEKDCTN